MAASSPRQLFLELYPSIGFELPISGGWADSQATACIINSQDPVARSRDEFNGSEIQEIFIEKSIYFELITSKPPNESCSSIHWSLVDQNILRCEDGPIYERMKIHITALLDSDFEMLKMEWEGPEGIASENFNIDEHVKKRETLTLHFERDYWFEISSFESYKLYGIDFPWIISNFKRRVTLNNEIQVPGLGYTIQYKDINSLSSEANSGKASIYVYDLSLSNIPNDLTKSIVTDHFNDILSEIDVVDKSMDRKSSLIKNTSSGDIEHGKGFLCAIFEVEQANAMLVSTLALFVFDGRFVKLRITVMKQETALESIFSFILLFQKSIHSES